MSGISDSDLQRLQEYLLENLEVSRCMPLDVAHGFLTAVASGPAVLMPGDWIPYVLGQPAYLDDEQVDWITGALLGLYKGIISELEAAKFGPMIINKPMHGEDPLPLPYGWCEGYLHGLDLHGEGVAEQVAKQEETSPQLAPILAFMMYEDSQLLDPPDPAAHRELAAELAGSAIQLYRWGQTQRSTLQ